MKSKKERAEDKRARSEERKMRREQRAARREQRGGSLLTLFRRVYEQISH